VSDTEEVTPALYDHACRVYKEMLKRSHTEEVEVSDPNDDNFVLIKEIDVYEGHLTRLFAELEIANPYYTKIRNVLVAQGCIDQLRRGGGVGLSKWILNHEPDEDSFKTMMERKRPPKGTLATLEQRVKDLMVLNGEIQDRQDEIEFRLKQLEESK
jgi:hypothetical protein